MSAGSRGLVPVEVVLDTIQRSLVLIGNASNYISEARRDLIVSKISQKQKGLGKMLRSVCQSARSEGSDLFGPGVHKALTERADTLAALKKALEKTSSLQVKPWFFRKGPTSEYGGSSGKGKGRKPYFPQRRIF